MWPGTCSVAKGEQKLGVRCGRPLDSARGVRCGRPHQKPGVRFGRPLDSAGVRFGRPWERSSGLVGLQHVCMMFCPCSGMFMACTLGALGLIA